MKKVTRNEVLIIILFYVFFSGLYHIVLWYNGMGFKEDGFWGWANLRDYWFAAGMQYLFYFLASIIIWFLGIRILNQKSVSLQMLAVLILIPIFIYIVREGRYKIIDSLGYGRLRGTGTIWDWYIPTLFMFIQFGCFFAYRYFKDNQRKLKLEGELRAAALKSELSAIKAQLNPHFLYNIFNTINASIPSENEKARNMIAELSDLFRYQLKASQTETVSIAEELEFIKKYLKLEKERFQERLNIVIDVEDTIKNEQIPPMLIQPLVENSIKHGLASLVEGGTISISIKKTADKLMFEIADTGVGVKDKTSLFGNGIGLTNTKLRLEKIYNSKLKLSDNTPNGLKINFSI